MKEAVKCACDCGETFVPRSTRNIYLNPEHRERHYTVIRAERAKAKPKSSSNITMVISRATEDERERNSRIIDRMIGQVLAGDLEPLVVPPGVKKVRARR